MLYFFMLSDPKSGRRWVTGQASDTDSSVSTSSQSTGAGRSSNTSPTSGSAPVRGRGSIDQFDQGDSASSFDSRQLHD
jgi:hypothetical protein